MKKREKQKKIELTLIGRLFTILFSLAFVWISPASAHDANIWPYVVVSCDNVKQNISVSEEIAESEATIPKRSNARGLDGMLQFVPIGQDDGVLNVKFPLVRTCKIGTSKYRLLVQPYNYNRRVQGMCGAAAPSVKLTISRNKKNLIRDLVFRINCFAEGDTDNEIQKISFSEVEQNADFQLLKKKQPIHEIIDFKMLPTLERKSLFP